jgi:predicted dehydrogenase
MSWNWSQGKDFRLCGREPMRAAIDEYYGQQKRSGQFRGCKAYSDYRELLEKEDINAVMVATPDHTHAVITMAALKRGKHVYGEKPLAYSVYETRLVTETARKAKVATQLGNQGQASESARVVREIIADGAIGGVREVHVYSPARFWSWPACDGRPADTPPVPAGLDWDLWLGPAPYRPYHPLYHPWTWRNWLDFGTGVMGDLGCHKLSTVFKALKLGHPIRVEGSCTKQSTELYPLGEIVRFDFPARGDMPPVTIHWYDGGIKPPRPAELEPDDRMGDILYIGDKGKLMGERLIPEERHSKYRKPPKSLPRSPGHYHEWVYAIRDGVPAGADYVEHAGLVSEVCMLGNIAVRLQKQLEWDGVKMEFPNEKTANKMLHREYRQGWAM